MRFLPGHFGLYTCDSLKSLMYGPMHVPTPTAVSRILDVRFVRSLILSLLRPDCQRADEGLEDRPLLNDTGFIEAVRYCRSFLVTRRPIVQHSLYGQRITSGHVLSHLNTNRG
jgi:hypothetical protein